MKKELKVLLVYPEMPNTVYAAHYLMDLSGKKAFYPPLGLLTIASMFPKNWKCELADLNIKYPSDAKIKEADLVMISAMNVQEMSVHNFIKKAKSLNATLVAGGSLFTHEHERFPSIDHFVLNEAELTLQEFINDYENGVAKRYYESKAFADITSSPIPDFSLVNPKDYLFGIIQYSRGCPYLCDFCDVTALLGRKPRTKTSAQVIAELELLVNNNFKLVLFADDNLIGNRRLLKDELLPAIIEWRKRTSPKFYFATQVTINLADDEELMQLLLDAGFRQIFVGIETPDEETLFHTGKKQNLKRNQIENIHFLHKKGFVVFGGFIVGFDTDKADIFDRQIQFIQESNILYPIVNILKAPPGTELFDKMKKDNRLIKDFSFFEGDTNLKTVMDEKTLYEGFLKLIEGIYHYKNSHARIISFIENYKYAKTTVKIPDTVDFRDFLTLFRLIWKVGIINPHRKYFWKLIGYGIFKSKNKTVLAIQYSALMYQLHNSYLFIKEMVDKKLKSL
jgi:radical SAM superfamily enzyme YgiQ (UPF0313 family)